MTAPAYDELAEHPFLRGMNENDLKGLGDHPKKIKFEAGQLVFREGAQATGFYLVQYGQIALETHLKDSGNILLQSVGDGDLLGWSWLFSPYQSHFDARAIEQSAAIYIDGDFMRQYCEARPEFGCEFYKRISQIISKRLQAAQRQISEFYGVR